MAHLTEAQETLLSIKSRLDFFENFTNDEVLRITEDVLFVRYKRGEVIFEQASTCKDIYYVINGTARIVYGRETAKGFKEHMVLANIPKHGIFGEMAAITSEPRSARAIAAVEGTMLLKFAIKEEIPQEDEMLFTNLYYQFIGVLQTKLLASGNRLYDIG